MNLHRNIFGSDMNLPQNISGLGTNLVGCESGQVRICPEIYLIQKFFEFVFFFFFFFFKKMKQISSKTKKEQRLPL